MMPIGRERMSYLETDVCSCGLASRRTFRTFSLIDSNEKSSKQFNPQRNTNIWNAENVVCRILLVKSVPICNRTSNRFKRNEINVVSHSKSSSFFIRWRTTRILPASRLTINGRNRLRLMIRYWMAEKRFCRVFLFSARIDSINSVRNWV